MGDLPGVPRFVEFGAKAATEPEPALISGYSQKFAKLTDKTTQTGVLGQIGQFLGNIIQKIVFTWQTQMRGLEFQWQTQMYAEHLSQGKLGGGIGFFAIGKTVDVLEKMNPQPKDLIKALNYAKNVSLWAKNPIFTGVGSVISAAIIKNDIKKLLPGESLVIPSSTPGHSMMLFITRQDNHTFKVQQHNQGIG